MTRRNQFHPLLNAGLLALATGNILKLTLHTSAGDAISSFLIGMSVALLIGGLFKTGRTAQR